VCQQRELEAVHKNNLFLILYATDRAANYCGVLQQFENEELLLVW
jgi:hypothetical protein